jgi:hypothetical protein
VAVVVVEREPAVRAAVDLERRRLADRLPGVLADRVE